MNPLVWSLLRDALFRKDPDQFVRTIRESSGIPFKRLVHLLDKEVPSVSPFWRVPSRESKSPAIDIGKYRIVVDKYGEASIP